VNCPGRARFYAAPIDAADTAGGAHHFRSDGSDVWWCAKLFPREETGGVVLRPHSRDDFGFGQLGHLETADASRV
jgi:hypothetical protein